MPARLQLRAQLLAQRLDVALAVGAPLVERRGHAAVLVGLEVTERQILELPLQLPDAEAVGERRVDGARLERAARALGGRQVARVAQRHQLLGETREHQARIAHHRQQHLAQRLGLARIEAVRRRPVARQSEVAQAHAGRRRWRWRA